MPSDAESVARKQLKRLRTMQVGSAEYTVVRTYIDWILDVPWHAQTSDKIDIAQVRQVLDESLRLWPTAPAFAVEALADTTVGEAGYPVRKGESVMVLTPQLHRDPAWGEIPRTTAPAPAAWTPPAPVPVEEEQGDSLEAIAAMDWNELRSAIARCKRCGDCAGRKPVYGAGAQAARWSRRRSEPA